MGQGRRKEADRYIETPAYKRGEQGCAWGPQLVGSFVELVGGPCTKNQGGGAPAAQPWQGGGGGGNGPDCSGPRIWWMNGGWEGTEGTQRRPEQRAKNRMGKIGRGPGLLNVEMLQSPTPSFRPGCFRNWMGPKNTNNALKYFRRPTSQKPSYKEIGNKQIPREKENDGGKGRVGFGLCLFLRQRGRHTRSWGFRGMKIFCR